jgi:hypothetical protein
MLACLVVLLLLTTHSSTADLPWTSLLNASKDEDTAASDWRETEEQWTTGTEISADGQDEAEQTGWTREELMFQSVQNIFQTELEKCKKAPGKFSVVQKPINLNLTKINNLFR